MFSFLVYLFVAALGLHCWEQAFSSSGKLGLLSRCHGRASRCGGYSLVVMGVLPVVVASLVAERGL